jgi:hypothetical protein
MFEENFEVIIASKDEKSNTTIITASEKAKKILAEAFDKYDPSNRLYSAYLTENSDSSSVTSDLINELSNAPQSDLKKITQINNIVLRYINKNDLIGITMSSIETNVNTNYKLSYKDFSEFRNKQKAIDKGKTFINDFNEQINLRRIIRNTIPLTYTEGTYILYLRKKDLSYTVDAYPLGVAIISDYDVNGDPVVLIDIKQLTNRLKKTMLKDKKGKPLFFDTVEKEIQENYPKEVYDAYKANESYAILDIRYTGVIRIGNLNRKYGLTPIFRAISPAIMLDTFEEADRTNTKAKAKKIIFQKLRKEVLGVDFTNDGFEEQAFAHENLMDAWKLPTVVVTPPATVENIEYVEPKSELTNIDIINQYRNRVMTCLGIGFLSQEGKQTVSTANISVEQLMLTINKISEQLEDVIYKWYVNVLIENGMDKIYAPKIKVIDAEQMSFEVKTKLAELLYSKLGASYKTVYETIGLDVEEEKQRRVEENELKFDEVFMPHLSSYTTSGKPESDGKPADENPKNPDKQQYDKNRAKTQ